MSIPLIALNDGNFIPQIGLGVWQANATETRKAVQIALQEGYRHIDTAAIYQNEEAVGQGFRDSGIPRDQVFITTKIWNDAHGAEPSIKAIDESLNRLGMEYVDLLLIHWPVPKQDLYIKTWQSIARAKAAGKILSIGVSNFNADHLKRLIGETNITPVLNQIELHPLFQRVDLRAFHDEFAIKTESWSPLGRGAALNSKVLGSIAEKHSKSIAQVIIRWHLQLGLIAIPKSVHSSRIRENIEVFDFSLDSDDLLIVAGLDQNMRTGPDPLMFP